MRIKTSALILLVFVLLLMECVLTYSGVFAASQGYYQSPQIVSPPPVYEESANQSNSSSNKAFAGRKKAGNIAESQNFRIEKVSPCPSQQSIIVNPPPVLLKLEEADRAPSGMPLILVDRAGNPLAVVNSLEEIRSHLTKEQLENTFVYLTGDPSVIKKFKMALKNKHIQAKATISRKAEQKPSEKSVKQAKPRYKKPAQAKQQKTKISKNPPRHRSKVPEPAVTKQTKAQSRLPVQKEKTSGRALPKQSDRKSKTPVAEPVRAGRQKPARQVEPHKKIPVKAKEEPALLKQDSVHSAVQSKGPKTIDKQPVKSGKVPEDSILKQSKTLQLLRRRIKGYSDSEPTTKPVAKTQQSVQPAAVKPPAIQKPIEKASEPLVKKKTTPENKRQKVEKSPQKKQIKEDKDFAMTKDAVAKETAKKASTKEKDDQQKETAKKKDKSEKKPAKKSDKEVAPGDRSFVVKTEEVNKGSVIYGVNSFDSGLHIEAASDLQSMYVEPGESFTISFQITNISGRPGHFVEEFDMPEGFQLAFPPAEFSLEPMETYNSIVMVTVPQYLKAGEHTFAYNVFERDDQAIHGSFSFNFEIMERLDLNFVIEEKPGSVIYGEDFTIKGKLFNNSNTKLSLGIEASEQKHFRLDISQQKADLAPGEFVDLVIKGKTGVGNRPGRSLLTYLTVRDLSKRRKPVLLKQIISIKFFTKARTKTDFKHRLPVDATVRVKSFRGEYSTQMEISSDGYLDDSHSRKIEFLVRDKGSNRDSGLSYSRETSSLLYNDRKMKVAVGDHSFGVAALSRSYAGRGLGVDYNLTNKTEVGFINYETRYRVNELEGKGAFVSHAFGRQLKLKLSHFVSTSKTNKLSPEERFTTMGFQYRPNRISRLTGEVGKKWGGRLADTRDAAFKLNYVTKVKKYATFSVSHSDTGVIYAGNNSGNETTRTSVTIPLSKKIRSFVSYSKSKQHQLVESDSTPASQNDSMRTGVSYRLNKDTYFRLNYSDSHRFDRISNEYDIKTKSYTGAVTKNGRRYSSNYSFSKRVLDDLLDGTQKDRIHHRLNGSYKLSHKLMLNAYGSMVKNNSSNDYFQNDSNSLGMGFNWKMTNALTAIFNFRQTNYSETDRTSQNMNLNLNYKKSNNLVNFRVSKNSYSTVYAENPVYYQLSVTREFGVPVGRNKQIGALTGQVKEIVGSQTRSLDNITLLMKNMAAVTNSEGKFIFADLDPGTYTLDIDRRNSGINKISKQGLPLKVYIPGGKVASVTLLLEEGCTFSGQIKVASTEIPDDAFEIKDEADQDILAPMPAGFRKIEAQRLAGVILEIRSDKRRYTAVSDSEGKFKFYGLPSGSWKYRVYETTIPKGYRISPKKGVVNTTPEEEARLTFKVSPIIRKIEMVEAE